jgi:hypothetical protein
LRFLDFGQTARDACNVFVAFGFGVNGERFFEIFLGLGIIVFIEKALREVFVAFRDCAFVVFF